jgi:hypothetical protein
MVARLSDAKRQGSLEAELRRLLFIPLLVVDLPQLPRRFVTSDEAKEFVRRYV